jgi:hypothetical protein
MSKKSHPGDGAHGNGDKGLPGHAPQRGSVRVLLDLVRGVTGRMR